MSIGNLRGLEIATGMLLSPIANTSLRAGYGASQGIEVTSLPAGGTLAPEAFVPGLDQACRVATAGCTAGRAGLGGQRGTLQNG